MGYYIETPENTSKALQLIRMYQAVPIEKPTSFDSIPHDKALIVVVSNSMWDACGLVYDQGEFDEFVTYSNGRPRCYLLMDKELAHKLAGYPRRSQK